MKKALIVGGNSGIGLAAVLKLLDREYEHIDIFGKDEPKMCDIEEKYHEIFSERVSFHKINLINGDFSAFDEFSDVDTLVITAGFGRVAPFENLTEAEVSNLIKCNFESCIRIIQKFYNRISGQEPFYCAVMGSIAGHIASPLFSVYGAAKAGLCSFIENINVELAYNKCVNRVLDVSPGALKGTNFNGGGNQLSQVYGVAESLLQKMYDRETVYIPDYDSV